MQKIYLLLRNNKQSGPFTRDELLLQDLKKHDLVWVEGRSAGWRAPEEISELKMEPAVPLQPTHHSLSLENQEPAAPPTCSKHIYISLPSGTPRINEVKKDEAQLVPVAPAASPNEEEKQESFEERVLRMQQRIANFNSSQAATEDKEQVETKYARSLDDIKEEYAGWLHRQKKQKRKYPVKPMLLAAGGLFLIVLVSFFIFRSAHPALPLAATPESTVQIAGPQLLQEAAVKEKKPVAAPTVSKKRVASPDERPVKKTAALKYPSVRSTASKSSRAIKSVPANKEPAVEEPAIPLSQQIRVYGNDVATEKKGIGDFQLTVQNNSRQALKVVAVDVFYFGSNGQQLQKKTMYFSNLNPNRSLSLTTPGHKKATAVQYKLGLVSSGQGLYYAKQ